jgi:transposase-like protein
MLGTGPFQLIHSLAFKKQVVQEYAAGATLNGLAREHDLSRNLIRIWIAKCQSGEFDPDVQAAEIEFVKGGERLSLGDKPLSRGSSE